MLGMPQQQRGTTDERRRLALQIAAQLPDRVVDALGVLDDARELVLNFLTTGPRLVEPSEVAAPAPPACAPAPILRLVSSGVALLAAFLLGLFLDPPLYAQQAIAAVHDLFAVMPL